jgi:hypothetical protein
MRADEVPENSRFTDSDLRRTWGQQADTHLGEAVLARAVSAYQAEPSARPYGAFLTPDMYQARYVAGHE